MFFLIPGGLGGIFSYIIIILVIRLVFKSIYGGRNRNSYTHYYYTNQNQNNQQQQNTSQNYYPPRKNYYSVLGLTETASNDEIKKAYRKLIMEYHPDKIANNSNMDEKFKEFAAKRFREVQEAYEEICKLRGIK